MDPKSSLTPGRLTVLFHSFLDSQCKDASALGREADTEPLHRAPMTLLKVKKKT